MGYSSTTHPALLSSARIEFFRTQLASKHEAAFLAPQLLEQVSILTEELSIALRELASLRESMSELAKAYEQSRVTRDPTPDLITAVRDAVAHVLRDSSAES